MEIVILLVQLFLVLNLILGLASLCTWFERKGSALMQDRVGANRAGAFVTPSLFVENWKLAQLLPSWLVLILKIVLAPLLWLVRVLGVLGIINTLLCDSVKAIFKEDFVPEGVSNFMHCLAPFMAVFPVFLAFALVPLAPEFQLGGYSIKMQIAALNGGVLFIFAMGSVAVYGVALAGWSGNNKFSLLGALRAAAQMISYELAMGLSLVTMILIYGTLDLYQMVELQSGLLGGLLPRWGVFMQPLAFVVLFIVGMAETKRAPFDLPEAESELVAGYFTEYSGMKFLLFWLGEFAEIALFSLIMAMLFFGGWKIPYFEFAGNAWWVALIGHLVLMTKVVILSFLQIVIRWTLPRLRYDQLMNLGWKGLLPVSMVSLLVTGAAVIMW